MKNLAIEFESGSDYLNLKVTMPGKISMEKDFGVKIETMVRKIEFLANKNRK